MARTALAAILHPATTYLLTNLAVTAPTTYLLVRTILIQLSLIRTTTTAMIHTAIMALFLIAPTTVSTPTAVDVRTLSGSDTGERLAGFQAPSIPYIPITNPALARHAEAGFLNEPNRLSMRRHATVDMDVLTGNKI